MNDDIPGLKIAAMATNILYKTFIDSPADVRKNAYKTIYDGKKLYLTTVEMDDGSQLPFYLELDHSDYSGEANFSAFDASIELLITKLMKALKEQEKDVMVYEPRKQPNKQIFGVAAATQEAENTNVLVLGCCSGRILLNLTYVKDNDYTDIE